MLLRDYFHSAGIELFAYLSADSLPVIHPHLLRALPDVRTVLFAAIPYHVSDETSNLAMFARGQDYHAFARSLGEGASAILHQNHPDARSAAFADHSPYNEVAGAAMAGLGATPKCDRRRLIRAAGRQKSPLPPRQSVPKLRKTA